MRLTLSIASLLLGVIAATAPVCAQTQRSGGGEAQKFMQQYQQVAAEKTALQAQVAQMQKDLEKAKADLVAMKKERDELKGRSAGSAAAAARLAQVTAEKETAEKNLEQTKQKTNELVDRFKQTIGTLKGVESDREQLRKDNADLSVKFDKCAANNLQLFEINNDILNRYEHVGPFTKISSIEPFTKITRTRINNLVDETRERAEELRVKKSPPGAPAVPH
jgi:chromosome segregation ATPase